MRLLESLSSIASALRRSDESSDRMIFRYFDGNRKCGADPIAFWRKLHNDPQWDMAEDLALVDEGDIEAISRTAEAVRRALGLKPLTDTVYEQSGITDAEAVDILADFVDFLDGLKKSTSPLLTSADATDQPLPGPTESPIEPDGSDMKQSSDSGSTSNGAKPVEPSDTSTL